ncbi:MAG: acetyltransferase [Promethearchaeota archaeon]
MSSYVVCAGGQGRVVLDYLRLTGVKIVGFFDDVKEGEVEGVPVLGKLADIPRVLKEMARKRERKGKAALYVALGDNAARERLCSALDGLGRFPNLVHPSSIVSRSAQVKRDAGLFVGPVAVVNTNATLGRFCLVNSGAIVEHDVQVGEFSSLGPGAIVAGGVTLGKRVTVGLGAKVLNDVTIGDDVVVGAGAVVTKSFGPGKKVLVGVPARELVQRD